MSAIIIDDGLVHYEALGRGKPLLLLHGWLGSWRYWVPVMEELSVSYRAYAVDMWGFGDTDRRKGRYEIESYVQLLDNFVENLGIVHMSLPIVGHALGAVVAVIWASRNPERVDRIMAVNMPLEDAAINQRLSSPGALGLFDKALNVQPADFAALQMETRKADEQAIHDSVRSVMSLDVVRALERIEQPVLLVHGAQDNIITPDDGEDFVDSDFVRDIYLNESRHFPMLDERPKFNRLLRDFLVADDLDTLSLKDEWRRTSR